MKAQTRVYVWGAGTVVLAVLVLLLLRAGGAQLAIGGDLGTDPSGLRMSILYRSGGADTKSYALWRYADCTPDFPNYVFYKANTYHYADGRVAPSTSAQTLGANLYSPNRDVYAFSPGWERFTTARPRQHPDCVAEIRAFAQSANVNVTEVVFVTNERNVTVTERVYVNQTVYVCEDGQFATDSSACSSPVAVAKPYGMLARLWDWLWGLFA